MSHPSECACPPECPERCTPLRLCADVDCSCYQLWLIELELAREQVAHLSATELHKMMIDKWG